jgi:hypothetical protein
VRAAAEARKCCQQTRGACTRGGRRTGDSRVWTIAPPPLGPGLTPRSSPGVRTRRASSTRRGAARISGAEVGVESGGEAGLPLWVTRCGQAVSPTPSQSSRRRCDWIERGGIIYYAVVLFLPEKQQQQQQQQRTLTCSGWSIRDKSSSAKCGAKSSSPDKFAATFCGGRRRIRSSAASIGRCHDDRRAV